jgi:hypothetical protein
MPVSVKLEIFNKDVDDSLVCFRCQEKISHGERHYFWGIQYDKEFVQCSFHRAPTKKLVGLTVLRSYGYEDTWSTSSLFKINQVDGRGKILNPATPSFLMLDQIFELYENPSKDLVDKLITENLKKNRYWVNKAEEELKVKEVAQGDDGIRRGARVLGLDRHCTNCGVAESDMVAKNPKYTLCRGVCVVCYRKLYRKTNAIHDNGTAS